MLGAVNNNTEFTPPPKPWETGASTTVPPVTSNASLTPPSTAPAIPPRNYETTPNMPPPTSYNTGYNSYNTGYSGYGSNYSGYNSGYGGLGYGSGFGGGYGTGFGSGYSPYPSYGGGFNSFNTMNNNAVPSQQPPTGFTLLATSTLRTVGALAHVTASLAHLLDMTASAVMGTANAVQGVRGHLAQMQQSFASQVTGLTGLMVGAQAAVGGPLDQLNSSWSLSKSKKRKRITWSRWFFILVILYAFVRLLRRFINPGATSQSITNTPTNVPSITFATALYPYSATSSRELTLSESMLVAVLTPHAQRDSVDWWWVRSQSGTQGYIPKSYLRIMDTKNNVNV